MRKFFTVVARFFASLFAILFVLTAVLALLLSTIERNLFKADLYKRAFAEQQIYDRLPRIIGVTLTSSASFNPCAQNPLACKIDSASPELQACLKAAFGQEAYTAIGSGLRNPTEAELQFAQPCLDQYSTPATNSGFQSGENPLPTASSDVQACVKQAVGEKAYDELYNNQRQPTEVENQQMQPCFEQSGTSAPGDQGGMPPLLKNLTASDWEAIINIVIPPPELKMMTENVLDQIFSYLNGEVDTVSLSLVKLKQRLTGQAGIDTIKQLLRAQPPCTQEQLDQITSNSGSELVLCNPTENDLNKVMSQVQEQLTAAINQIPDEVTILKSAAPSTAPSNNNPLGNDPMSVLRTVRWILRLSPLLPFGFLLLVTLFAVRSFKSWMSWWGIPFFFAGIIALGLGIAAVPALNWTWDTFLVVRIPPYLPTSVVDIGHELARSIVHSLTNGIVLQALILTVIGLAAWIGSYFIKTKIKPQAGIIIGN